MPMLPIVDLDVADAVEVLLQPLLVVRAQRRVVHQAVQLGPHQVVDALAGRGQLRGDRIGRGVRRCRLVVVSPTSFE